MEKEDIQEWLINTKKLGYIDCQSSWDEEFDFIIDMAKELLKRM